MKRRELNSLLALAPLAGTAGLAQAQGGPVEGKHYAKLGQVQPTTPGKIEVIEFFFYRCPHCYALDPIVEVWKKGLPPDVLFRRVPIGTAAQLKILIRMYYALESMGQTEATHTAIFNAIHRDHLELADEAGIVDFLQRIGQDTAKFKQAFNSFGIQTKVQQANKLAEAYGVDGVPALCVAGRWRTSPGQAGQPGASELVQGQQALAVVDYLIKLSRGKA
jgi:thiol:disulfide interchange protein DsbA